MYKNITNNDSALGCEKCYSQNENRKKRNYSTKFCKLPPVYCVHGVDGVEHNKREKKIVE